jgi:AcrR family transcriptional regulator
MIKNKREKILDAALEMFVNNGFESSPTSKIAKEAGVATGTLFHYFKTKNDLINELYLDVKLSMVSTLKENLHDAKTIRQKLENIWFNFITWALKNQAAMKFFAMYGTSSYISANTREEGLRQFAFMIDIIKTGIREEILKDVALELLLESAHGIMTGAIKYYSINFAEFKNEDKRKQAFSIFWDALKM